MAKREKVWWGVEYEMNIDGEHWRPCIEAYSKRARAKKEADNAKADAGCRNVRGPIPLVERKRKA